MARYNLVYEELDFDYKVFENGDFSCRNVYHLKNIGAKPISITPLDDGLWFSSPKNVDLKIKVLSSKKGHKVISHRTNIYETLLKIIPGKKSYIVSWNHEISPPLDKNDSLVLEIIIDTTGTEKDAFTADGTYAGIPTVLPTKKATLNFVAPPGYVFEMIIPKIVHDAYGNTDEKEISRIKQPRLNKSKTLLSWEIEHCLAQHRYSFNYRLLPE